MISAAASVSSSTLEPSCENHDIRHGALWGEPSEDKRQPHIVQYTAVLTDADAQQELDFVNYLIKRDAPDAAAAGSGHHARITLVKSHSIV